MGIFDWLKKNPDKSETMEHKTDNAPSGATRLASKSTQTPIKRDLQKHYFSCDLYENDQEETQKILRDLRILKVVGGQTVDLQFEGEAPVFSVTIDGKYVGKTCVEDGTLLDENWDNFTLKDFYVRGGGTAENGESRPYVFSLRFETKPGISPLKLSEIKLPPCKVRKLTTGDEIVFLSSTKKIHRSSLAFGCGIGPAGCKPMLYEEAKAAGGIECAKCFK